MINDDILTFYSFRSWCRYCSCQTWGGARLVAADIDEKFSRLEHVLSTDRREIKVHPIDRLKRETIVQVDVNEVSGRNQSQSSSI